MRERKDIPIESNFYNCIIKTAESDIMSLDKCFVKDCDRDPRYEVTQRDLRNDWKSSTIYICKQHFEELTNVLYPPEIK